MVFVIIISILFFNLCTIFYMVLRVLLVDLEVIEIILDPLVGTVLNFLVRLSKIFTWGRYYLCILWFKRVLFEVDYFFELVFLVLGILTLSIGHLSAGKERWQSDITFVTIRASILVWLFIGEINRVLVVLELTFSFASVHEFTSIKRLLLFLNVGVDLISRIDD